MFDASTITSSEDILIWMDDSWCYRYELPEMSHKSDDFRVVLFGTSEHTQLCKE